MFKQPIQVSKLLLYIRGKRGSKVTKCPFQLKNLGFLLIGLIGDEDVKGSYGVVFFHIHFLARLTTQTFLNYI